MGFRDDIDTAIYNGACSIMNRAEGASRWGAGAGFSANGPRNSFGSINLTRTAATAAGYFCNTPPVPDPPLPYTGGQCQTDYSVSWTWDRYYDGQLVKEGDRDSAGFGVGGPIYSITMHSSAGYPVALTPAGEVVLYSNASGGRVTYRNLRDITVTRRDGKPDNCGNPNSPVTPIPAPDRQIPITVGGVNAQLAIGNGIVQVNGDVTAPIRVNSPDFDFSGELVLNRNEITLNFGGADPNRPCQPSLPGTDEPPPDDDEPPPDDDEPPTIIGVIVTTTLIEEGNGSTIIEQDDNPDVYAPNLGFVNFRLKVGDAYAWSSDIPVKVARNFIPAPQPFPAVDVAGTPRPGVTWEITPVYGVQPAIEFT